MIAEQGHLIGNHTWRHVQVTSLPKEEAEEEILAVSSLVEELTGNGTSYVRPPFGIWDPELEEELDMIPVLWTIDTLDWTTQNVDWIVEKTVQDAGENDIILMHSAFLSRTILRHRRDKYAGRNQTVGRFLASAERNHRDPQFRARHLSELDQTFNNRFNNIDRYRHRNAFNAGCIPYSV